MEPYNQQERIAFLAVTSSTKRKPPEKGAFAIDGVLACYSNSPLNQGHLAAITIKETPNPISANLALFFHLLSMLNLHSLKARNQNQYTNSLKAGDILEVF